jgi:ABC-type transporter Mla MlaB component
MGLGELTVERYEGVADDQRILLLRGPITIDTAPQFERAVRLERAETMILDLSDVPYIDSVGLGSLVTALSIASENGTLPGADGDEAAGAQDPGNHEGEGILRNLRHDVGSGGSAGEHRDGLTALGGWGSRLDWPWIESKVSACHLNSVVCAARRRL